MKRPVYYQSYCRSSFRRGFISGKTSGGMTGLFRQWRIHRQMEMWSVSAIRLARTVSYLNNLKNFYRAGWRSEKKANKIATETNSWSSSKVVQQLVVVVVVVREEGVERLGWQRDISLRRDAEKGCSSGWVGVGMQQ